MNKHPYSNRAIPSCEVVVSKTANSANAFSDQWPKCYGHSWQTEKFLLVREWGFHPYAPSKNKFHIWIIGSRAKVVFEAKGNRSTERPLSQIPYNWHYFTIQNNELHLAFRVCMLRMHSRLFAGFQKTHQALAVSVEIWRSVPRSVPRHGVDLPIGNSSLPPLPSAVFVEGTRSLSFDFQIWYPHRWFHARCSSERGRFELVNERFWGRCDEICEPATDGLGSELFTLRLIVIWGGYVHSLGIFWPSQHDGSILSQPALCFFLVGHHHQC